jgi:hypothetical protein
VLDAYTVGITLALNNGVSDGVAAIRRDLMDLNQVAESSANALTRVQHLTDALNMVGPTMRVVSAPNSSLGIPTEPVQQDSLSYRPAEPSTVEVSPPAEPSSADLRPPDTGVGPSSGRGPYQAALQPAVVASPVQSTIEQMAALAEPVPARAVQASGVSPVMPNIPSRPDNPPPSPEPLSELPSSVAAPSRSAPVTPMPPISAPPASIIETDHSFHLNVAASPEATPGTQPSVIRRETPSSASPVFATPPVSLMPVSSPQRPVAALPRLAPVRPPAEPDATQGERTPDGRWSEASPVAPSFRFLAADPPSAPSMMPSAAPPPTETRSEPMQGDVYLDGTRLGRWMVDHLAREAGRPPAGTTNFDPRLSVTWPGPPISS